MVIKFGISPPACAVIAKLVFLDQVNYFLLEIRMDQILVFN